ncbi:MAG TPA: class I SAM-dependent methyltransferase [Polyangiaceae bacterium]|nr:class I SAM-dependent methyltransferase [Polyangiaceae bacterium]
MTAYKKLCTEFYDLDKPHAPADALDFYLQYAADAGGPILEPMCGTGRFLLPLLARGFDVEGLDSSPEMLSACRARARSQGLSPVLHEQNLVDFSPQRQFGLVFIPSGSFCLLTAEATVRAALGRIFSAMLPGATFLVEVERLLPREASTSGTWGGRWLERPDGAKLIISWLSQYSGVEGISRSIHRYELVKDGQLLASEYEDFELKFYEPEAFRKLLEEAGFWKIQLFKAYARAEPSDADEGLIFACQKPAR